MFRIISTLCIVLLCPQGVFAQDASVSRRDSFLLLWDSIKRPAFETYEEPYVDVQEGAEGFKEITWGKRRGILEDETTFRPDADVSLQDALLWLYRTRNVDELDVMQEEHLDSLIAKYPVVSTDRDRSESIGKDELVALMNDLDKRLKEEVHEVSFYAEDFHGDGTAFGESFDMNAMTAAHRSYPENTLVRVTNVTNGKTVLVRINDRGPYVAGRDMDLSLAAFLAIEERSKGKTMATFERLGDVNLVEGPLKTDEEIQSIPQPPVQETSVDCVENGSRYQKRITRDIRFHRGVPHLFSLGRTLTLKSNKVFVVRGITYPDGSFHKQQDFVYPEESFSFTPNQAGEYRFLLGTGQDRRREMRMAVVSCGV